MSNNVIILGAGASSDAGIPMMGQFMDTMWTLARLGRLNDQKLSDEDVNILVEALKVREHLDKFHGRAAFDVWNIEDILSILAFSSREKLELMTKAIARVIELTCQMKYQAGNVVPVTGGLIQYLQFWRTLIDWSVRTGTPIPPIITFNYDLILERSLLEALSGSHYAEPKQLPASGIEVQYWAGLFLNPRLHFNRTMVFHEQGPRMALLLQDFRDDQHLDENTLLKVKLLKLHGSVNFPRTPNQETLKTGPIERLTCAVQDPLILPPVSNKATEEVGKAAWDQALEVLGNCKNLIVCGYSLPATDIYMQYFLKAALGPNQDLNRIFVFDPDLFRSHRAAQGEDLKKRYAMNFSPPVQRRIVFQPPIKDKWREEQGGTMWHLSHLLATAPQELLFG